MGNCDNNCEAVAGLNEASANLVQYSKLIDKWLNGGQNETVNIAGTNTPTLLNLAWAIKQLVGVYPDEQTITIGTDKKIRVKLKNLGGIKYDSNGLYLGLSNSGIKINSAGDLEMDLSNMPTDKFESMIEEFRKSLRLPKWLTADMNMYVNKTHANAADTLDEGRGESANKPFKNIQPCLDFITENYNLSNFSINVYLATGVYDPIILNDYQRNTGIIRIFGTSERDAKIQAWNSNAITANGGTWNLFDIYAQATSNSVGLPSTITGMSSLAANNSAIVRIYSGKFWTNCSQELTTLDCRCIRANNNSIIGIGGTGADIDFNCTYKILNGYILSASGGSILLYGNNNSDNAFHMGYNCLASAYASSGGKIQCLLNYTFPPKIIITSEALKPNLRYKAQSGGSIDTGGLGADYFPGWNAGTVEESTYSWYK